MKKWKEHIEKRQRFLARQLELTSKESEKAVTSELFDLTKAMTLILKEMSVTYVLRFGIFFVVILQTLMCLVVFVKKFFRR